jgi:hypothetical protein
MNTEAEEIRRIRNFWNTAEDRLSGYTAERSLVRRLRRKNREGRYMLESFVVLVVFTWVATTWTGGSPTWTRVLSAGLPVGYLLDSAIVNTSIVFVTRDPIHPLRSVLLTFVAFVNVGVAFAAIYALEQCLKHAQSFHEFVYFSFITLATIGFGDIVPSGQLSRWTVVAEVLTGLYFLAAVFSTVTAWPQRRS